MGEDTKGTYDTLSYSVKHFAQGPDLERQRKELNLHSLASQVSPSIPPKPLTLRIARESGEEMLHFLVTEGRLRWDPIAPQKAGGLQVTAAAPNPRVPRPVCA